MSNSRLTAIPFPPDAARRYGPFATATVLFFVAAAFFATRKLLWFDELFTVFIARQPDTATFYAALTSGGDTLPPLIHILTRLSIAVFGEHHLSIRLPAIAGYWLLIASVYAFVRYRCSAFAAWTAAAVPVAASTFWYAFEARPYGPLAGVSAFALVAWQRSEGAHRVRWLILLGALVIVALSLHWYAVLLVGILLGAEVMRAMRSGRLRAGVPAAILAGVLVSVPLLYPFFMHGLQFKGIIDAPEPLTFLFHAYDLLLGGFAPFLFLLLVIALYRAPGVEAPPAHFPGSRSSGGNIPAEEIAAAAACAGLPLLALLLATITNSQLLPRYTVPGVIGCAMLVGYAGERFVAGRPLRMTAWAAVLAAAVASSLIVEKLRLPDRSIVNTAVRDFSLLRTPATAAEGDLLIPDGLAFIRLAYYAPPEIRSRLLHVQNPENLGSYALNELARFAPLRVEPIGAIAARSGALNVYDVGFETPLLSALAKDRAVVVGPAPSSGGNEGSAYWQMYELTMRDRSAGAQEASR